MTSINPILNSMLDAYRETIGLEESDLPMNPCFERWLFDAWKLGLNPEGIRICIQERLKFNRKNQCKKGVELKHLVRTEEDVSVVLCEVALFKASQRIKVMDPARASVLNATGRLATMPEHDAVRIDAIPLIEALRKAAQ